MKSLYFCRHAKSDWSTSLPDHDRPLNDRGLRSVPVMAAVWKAHGSTPLYWISSSAKRALRTAQLMASEMNDTISIRVEQNLYHASVSNWLEVLTNLPEDQDAVALFGHNPGITDIVNYLSDSDIPNIPTCGMARIDFTTKSWDMISVGTGSLAWYEYPKRHKPFD